MHYVLILTYKIHSELSQITDFSTKYHINTTLLTGTSVGNNNFAILRKVVLLLAVLSADKAAMSGERCFMMCCNAVTDSLLVIMGSRIKLQDRESGNPLM
jgi:hypothetical protein